MGCFKLDKIDKIFISLLFIIVTFICVSNTFCYASEEQKDFIDVVVESSGVLEGYSAFGDIHTVSSVDLLYYYKLEPGVEYTLTSQNYPITSNNGGLYYSNSLEEGSITETISTRIYETFTFTAQDYDYFIVSHRNNIVDGDDFTNGNFILTKKVQLIGINGVVENLINDVGINQLWKVFENSIPYLLVVVLFSLGVWFIKHNIIEHSKGRDF